jgi:ureidoglycolate lyase
MKAIELNEKNFSDYGKVLTIPAYSDRNSAAADNEEITYWKRVACFQMPGKLSSGVMACHDRERIYRTVERHTNTPEILVALNGDIVFLAAESLPGENELVNPELFYMKKGQAIVFHPGTWHYAPFPINAEEAFLLVIFAEGTEDMDMDVMDIEDPIIVEV